jgi:hypothetical protein
MGSQTRGHRRDGERRQRGRAPARTLGRGGLADAGGGAGRGLCAAVGVIGPPVGSARDRANDRRRVRGGGQGHAPTRGGAHR